MAYVQNGVGYTLKCDKCGTLLHREGKDKPFLSLDINELDSIAKEYGWLINKRVKTEKNYKEALAKANQTTDECMENHLIHLPSGKTIEAVGTIDI